MDDVKNISIEWRGTLLHHITYLELALNKYIMDYFCGSDHEKAKDLLVLILGDERLALMPKVQVFTEIAKNKHSKWYSSYKSLREPDKGKKEYTIGSDLAWVVEQRNIFAHRIFGMIIQKNGEEVISEKLSFIKLKNEIGSISYTRYEFKILIKSVEHLTRFIGTFDYLKSTKPPLI